MSNEVITFRDRISTINESGGRKWVYAKKPKGKLYNYRQIFGYSLLAFFLVCPFIKVNGEQFLLFNVLQRKFVIFGQIFYPQDFHLFVIAMLTFIVFVLLFTVIYGRVWCGWACPQTIFLELIFRRIEYLIEGDAAKQKQRNNGPFTFDRIWRKTVKHIIFSVLAIIIANYFVAYLVGTEKLFAFIQDGPLAHLGSFTALAVFTILFYGVFAFIREQACTLICPYGRLQGVLLDTNSIVVAYDHKRGEPRDRFKKGEDRKSVNKGDCVNCGSCTLVCPTGIDIRNGTQLECVNCTACIDACNSVMTKVGLPKGLIRFTSSREIENGEKFRFTPRMIAYSGVLAALLILFTSLVFIRGNFETTILRVPGQLYQQVGTDSLSNLYNIKIINKSSKVHHIEVKLIEPDAGHIRTIGKPLVIEKNQPGEGVFFVILNNNVVDKKNSAIKLGVYSNGELQEIIKSSFVGPIN